ncbi:hypothetical protein [Streptomyces sp. NPDC002328]|uniref:hypothetical protein n=1 Tax=Streptomyces sp. NPDC002328 TaxID=3364642 RepID=UPI0036ADB622
MGKYAYTAGAVYSALDVNGALHGEGARLEPRVTESLLHEFLTLLDAAQAELNQRWSGQRIADRRADRM